MSLRAGGGGGGGGGAQVSTIMAHDGIVSTVLTATPLVEITVGGWHGSVSRVGC